MFRIDFSIRSLFGPFLKLIILAIIVGVPFWMFLVQLAEHGWK